MKLYKKYKDINDTLKHLRLQVYDGLPYAEQNTPTFSSPQAAFNWLKARTQYKKDPVKVELLQSLPTLLEDNFHGIKGAGDCDCFTIALLTLLKNSGFKNLYIVLAGRNKRTPVHIYPALIDDKGDLKIMDLTNKKFDKERHYPYTQHLKFK